MEMTERIHRLSKISALGCASTASLVLPAFHFFSASRVARTLPTLATEPCQPIFRRSEGGVTGPKTMNVAMAVEQGRKEEEERGRGGVEQQAKVK